MFNRSLLRENRASYKVACRIYRFCHGMFKKNDCFRHTQIQHSKVSVNYNSFTKVNESLLDEFNCVQAYILV